MSCLLTRGFEKDCRDSVGGIKTVYLTNWSEVEDYTEVDGSISAMTLATGANFHEYQLRRQTSSFTETYEGSEENGTLFHEQEITVILTRLEADKRNEMYLMGKGDVVLVAVDNNNNYIVFGLDNGLTLSGNATSGTAFGDLSGYELTFTGQEKFPARFTSGSVIDGLLGA